MVKIPPGMSQPALRYSRMAFRAVFKEAYFGNANVRGSLVWYAPILGKAVGVSAIQVLNWWDGKDSPNPQMWERIIEACVKHWTRSPETQTGSS